MLKGFKAFVTKGNVVDLAVGVIIGVAFSQVVDSLVKDIITPIIGLFGGQPDFSAIKPGGVAIGNFINAVISFLIKAAGLYFLIALPFTSFRVALAVQMQVTRVFWILDFAATGYLCWWLMDDRLRLSGAGRRVAAGVLLATVLVNGILALVMIIQKKRVRRTLRNIGILLSSLATFHMPGPELSIDHAEALNVPFGVAVAVTVLAFTVSIGWRTL